MSLKYNDYKTISWRDYVVPWLGMIIKEMDSTAERFLQEVKKAMEPVSKEYHFQPNKGIIYPCTDFKFKEPCYFGK